jgi:hypothetical protein
VIQTQEEMRPFLSIVIPNGVVGREESAVIGACQLLAKSRFLRFAFGMTTHFRALGRSTHCWDGAAESRALAKH